MKGCEGKMSKKHAILMVACCLIPVAGLAAIYLFKLPFNAVLIGLMLVVCPLSHLFTMNSISHEEHEVTTPHSHHESV